MAGSFQSLGSEEAKAEAQAAGGAEVTPQAPAPTAQIRPVVDYELLFTCVHCGLCLEACPTYNLTRLEMDSPRGRVYLMKALAEGQLELVPEVTQHLDFCLGCRGCETACPSGVRYGQLIEQARSYVHKNYRRPLSDRIKRRLVDAIFPYPRRMRLLLAPLRIAERMQLRGLVERLAPGMLRDWLELLPPLDAPVVAPEEPAPQSAHAGAAGGPRVAIHRGCVAQVLGDSANGNAQRLLSAAGYRASLPGDTVCCGALDLHTGNRKRALAFARANLKALKNSGADAIVSMASGCSTALAEYGELFKDDPELAAPARELSAKVRDLSTLLLERPGAFSGRRCVVTYHDACHLAHGLGIREQPRALLRSIPGVKLVEMERADFCCGSAGTYNLTEPEAARELGRRKAETIVATEADYVVLANPGCQFQIAAELRRRGAHTKVIHLADFLALCGFGARPESIAK